MKVLMTTDTVGGIWTYCLELARSLGELGVEIGLATMGDPLSPSQRRAVAGLPDVTVFESTYKLEWMQDPWDDLENAGDWLLEVEDRFEPDVIHLNSYVHGSLPWRAPLLVVGHSCVLSWWEAVKALPAPPEWDHYRELVTQGIRCAGLVVAPSHTMLDALDRHYGPFSNSGVIYNARSAEHFRPGGKGRLIFASGRLWDEGKNLRLVERVASRVKWPIYLAGETVSPDGGLVEFGGLKHLGRLSQADMAQWLGRAAICVHPARYEPFGLGVLEAALCGCALVLGDIPSLRELWNGCALFVSPDDAEGLLHALELLMDDADLRHQLAAAAAEQGRSFAPERQADEYLDAYDLVMSRVMHPLGAEAVTVGPGLG